MATKGRTTNKTVKRQSSASKTRRTTIRRKSKNSAIVNFYMPLAFIVCIVTCLGILAFWGYRTVTASSFFDVKTIEIRGNSKVSREEIERIAKTEAEKKGVWNANLNDIKVNIEKLPFVKKVVVSRSLPDGLRIRIEERVGRAVVKTSSGDYWADEDAEIIGQVAKNEPRPAFVMRGWDESKTEKAGKENRERVRLYLKMQEEWQTLGLARRVNSVNLEKLEDAQAILEDSGVTVSVMLGKEDFGSRLKKALETIEGKGRNIESVISHQGNVIAKYRNS